VDEVVLLDFGGEFGPALREGDVAHFRCADEDISFLAKLQTQTGARASAWRVRRPNLNDVFLWLAAGKVLKEC
jgi:hypothetical protein